MIKISIEVNEIERKSKKPKTGILSISIKLVNLYQRRGKKNKEKKRHKLPTSGMNYSSLVSR